MLPQDRYAKHAHELGASEIAGRDLVWKKASAHSEPPWAASGEAGTFLKRFD
jgi:hypothetical protein